MITIFTDGSSKGNPGPGGWAAIIADLNQVIEIGGAAEQTTNNKMELTAAIEALKAINDLKLSGPITLHTDSEYLLKGITQWIHGWQRNNWKTAAKKPVENQDLWWALLESLKMKSVTWKLVRGHAGVSGNERCDVIATSFADKEHVDLYNGDRDKYKHSLQA